MRHVLKIELIAIILSHTFKTMGYLNLIAGRGGDVDASTKRQGQMRELKMCVFQNVLTHMSKLYLKYNLKAVQKM